MRKPASCVFLIAFCIRLLAIPTSLLLINPYSTSDALRFAARAQEYAGILLGGSFPPVHLSVVLSVWGTVLAPFWILPGPSLVYALLFVALLGALSVYNIYIITAAYGGRQAGIFAAAPLTVLPSYVLIHSALLREAAVLFGITTAVRLLLAPSERLRLMPSTRILFIILALGFASIFRLDNIPIYLAGLIIGGGVVIGGRYDILPKLTTLSGIGLILAIPLSAPYIRELVQFLSELRLKRATGRTAYLAEFTPTSIIQAGVFSWIGVIYFLFTPFPWMVHNAADFIAFGEAIINIGYAVMAVVGWKILAADRRAGAIGLGFTFLIGVVLYGLGTANVGTAVRHRQMFMWVLFMFGGLYLGEKIKITL